MRNADRGRDNGERGCLDKDGPFRLAGEDADTRRFDAGKRESSPVRLVGTEPMKRITPLLLFSASVAVGCTQLEDNRIEARQRRMARAAYVTSPGACNGMQHSVDYAKGFEAGYFDVASGGDGCPPALPPKKYWSATYNSPVGQEHVKAWFQGFRDGAAAARADGVASYGTIYVADEHRIGLRRAAQGPAPGVVPPAPQPLMQPYLTPGVPQQVPILGPGDGAPLQPPMSDARKSPLLRKVGPADQEPDVQKPAPLAQPPSAWRPAKQKSTSLTITPVAASPGSSENAPIPAVSASAKETTQKPTAEPVRLKLPELELPAGFAPEAGLGEPKSVRANQ